MKILIKKLKVVLIYNLILLISCVNESNGQKLAFKLNIGSEPATLDPQLINDTVGSHIASQMFIGILDGDPKTGGYRPGLAKSWDISDDGIVYTFHLRDNLVWSDGIVINSEGIRKSYLRILDKETGSSLVNIIKSTIKNAEEYFDGKVGESALGIKAVDEKTLEITLKSPKPYFLDMLVHQTFIPVPVHVIEKYGQRWTDPENMVVSGPFKLKSRILNEKIVLEKNNKYYKSKDIVLNNVIFFITDNSITAYNMYLNDELDAIFNNVPPDLLKDLKLRDDYYSMGTNSTYFYAFNTNVKPLDNVKVRKALSLAIDRKTLTESVLNDSSIPTRRATPDYVDYSYKSNLSLFDDQMAKKLLSDAGYPNGNNFPLLKVKYNVNDRQRKIAEFIQNQWKKNLNINVQLENEEWSTYINSRVNGNYEIIRAGWSGDYADPMTFLSIFKTENTAFSSYGYSNSEYDKLLIKSDHKRNISERQEILKRAEAILIERDFPATFINVNASSYLFRSDRWKGWEPNISERFNLSEIKPIK
ncbi:peptide ABC transporter substrate-binding protein (plasmid) [Borrelia sp. CA_690]|uniref:Peptide ABC transporter substrate-binding protein n=1 Tax=Borrelia maritima TaxID=2761123 RepID=A0A5J6WBU5_9SPIR|nr:MULTISPECIES: peptide ABC transporter substrate-binding protein [Borrelia]QFI15050.1 peptide ABC transporter substrate-binding protein [Borrelia maritima]WKC83942.1 peptide ABC transporter substrate-binding protein [Borrelia sp. CA_690]